MSGIGRPRRVRGERRDLLGRVLFPWRLLLAIRSDIPVRWSSGDGGGDEGDGLPPLEEGSVVKLAFERVWPSAVERLWVRVEVGDEGDGWHMGRVDCEPYRLRRPRFGDRVRFTRAHVIEEPAPGA
ncbi:hypothetical protein QUV83_02980 [Cellulomonas cellasea]|uniref:hypothetical protein n=1 Tax=Cellulomonas cellasea TaxID=43670 RepID=UPI0025A41C33|nr:hypothetical protein [Cellulomonas cellasea]MDM8083728.1 hypothetical protein [Cellulomonas cellasea]